LRENVDGGRVRLDGRRMAARIFFLAAAIQLV
jgi:hypothetical protein